MADGNNVLDYPQMTRQREENIQANEIAYAEDVNAELNYIMSTYNQLVAMLTGEWGDGTGRIYELVDNAVSLANQAIAAVQNCVLKTGDTMTGHLNIALVPASDYNVVNKKYVDDTIDAELADPINRISQLETWKENLDATQVKLSNANFSGTNVNDGMNELFISVSNGKAIVAAAITGKGVQTASDASFKTMADNINAILTFTEGTSGGTATENDIFYGKTAYARGSLIVGNYIPLDTSDATATSGTIAEGYTAYARGQKITGTMRAYPVFGTDTSDATATESDIAYGKTAYARGQKLIGTANNGEVEEIYGTVDEAYDVNTAELLLGTPPNGAEKLKNGRKIFRTSKDGNYCVSYVTGADTNTKYIESFPINNNGLYYSASAGDTSSGVIYKKYRYTFEELGLYGDYGEPAIEVTDMCFGAPGFGGVSNKCILAIAYLAKETADNNAVYIKFLTYHLSDNGIIGKAYEYETDYIDLTYKFTKKYYNDDNTAAYIASSNTNYNEFWFLLKGGIGGSSWYPAIAKGVINAISVSNDEYGYAVTVTVSDFGNSKPNNEYIRDMKLINSGRYCIIHEYINWYTNIRIFDTENYMDGILFGYSNLTDLIEINGSIYGIEVTKDDTKIKMVLYNFTEEFTISNATKVKTIYFTHNIGSYTLITMYIGYATADNKNLIMLLGGQRQQTSSDIELYNSKIFVLDINTILTAEDETTIDVKQSISCPEFNYISSTIGRYINATGNTNDTRIQITVPYSTIEDKDKFMKTLLTTEDTENIIAIKYKNQYFSKVQPQTLSAGGPDVRAGKTFIGWMGYPETGTLEV